MSASGADQGSDEGIMHPPKRGHQHGWRLQRCFGGTVVFWRCRMSFVYRPCGRMQFSNEF